MVEVNKYNKRLQMQQKYTEKKKRISTTFDIDIVCFTVSVIVNKAISPKFLESLCQSVGAYTNFTM